jgi:seryl-tRNA synthetase
MPSRGNYGETHSCSSFYDFQARRLKIRVKDADGKARHVFTLNNTAAATPRLLIPLLENHQRPDGTIHIPVALRKYLGGKSTISSGMKEG